MSAGVVRPLHLPATLAPGTYGRFPERLSPQEIAGAFFLDDADRLLIARRRRDASRLGFALQLGTVRALGLFLEDPSAIPAQAVRFVAREIGVTTEVSGGLADYARGELRWDHQGEIRRVYGYRELGESGVERAFWQWLEARAWLSGERQGLLVARAMEHLYAQRVLLPRQTTLDRMVASARDQANRRGFAQLAQAVSPARRERLEELLAVPEGARDSHLERLRRGPVAPTAAGLIAALERLGELRGLAEGLDGLDGLPPARLRALAGDARVKRARAIRRMSSDRRAATLVAFAATAVVAAHDDAIEHLERVLGELALRVDAQDVRARVRTLGQLDAAGRDLAAACAVLLDEDLADAGVREAVFAEVGRERLGQALERFRALSRPAAERHHDLLVTRYPHVRRFLPALLSTLQLEGTDAGQEVIEAVQALREIEGRRVVRTEEVPLALARRGWRALVEPEEGRIDRRAYTFCVLEALRDGLHRRDVFVRPSERFGDPRAILLGEQAWGASREETCRALGLPMQVEPFLDGLGAQLDQAWRGAGEDLVAGQSAAALARGELVAPALDAVPEPASLVELRRRVDALMPEVELPDLLLEVAARTDFAQGFAEHHRGGVEDLATSICAVLVARGCNVGLTPLVNASHPALTRSRLDGITQTYLHPDAIAAANARIVAYHSRLSLARAWGGGEVASVDGMRFVVPTRTIHAGYARRYFHRMRGVSALGTTSDQFTGLGTIVITGTRSEAIYLMDCLLDPQTILRPREVMSDTAGATDLVFGLFRLLGYQYSPRLADAGGARFWRMDPTADYGALNTVARHQIDLRLITERYDELLRVAGSLTQGHTTASTLMRALRGRSRETARLARAIGEVGRVAKTIHLLAYLGDEDLRRRIQVQLNRGEGRHALARQVFHGRRGQLHQAYRDGQEEQLGVLGLVVNAIVLWNTIYIERALEHLRAQGHQVREEDVARLSPLAHEHINLVGLYRLVLAEVVRRGAYRDLNQAEEMVA